MVHETNIRVRYAETDKMGYVYHGNYATYFEVGRVEFLRSQGYAYRTLEETGVMMPVVSLDVRFLRPAMYDDLLTVTSQIESFLPKRMVFKQEVLNEEKKVLTSARVELAFVDAASMRPIACPDNLADLFRTFLSDAGKD